MQQKKREEIAFEEYCKKRLWHPEKIPEANQEKIKTPDYFVFNSNNVPIGVFEIKLLEETELDKKIKTAIWQSFMGPKRTVFLEDKEKNTSISALRNKINDANNQFKFSPRPELPNILVLYSNRITIGKEITPELIEIAINGHIQLKVINQKITTVKRNGASLHPCDGGNSLVSAIATPNDKGGLNYIPNRFSRVPVVQEKMVGFQDCWMSELQT